MKNGRCRLHGGLSTGPRTAEGRARCAAARRTHGFYSAEMVALRRAGAAHCRRMDALIVSLKVRRTAGHGVLPSNLSNRGTGRADTRPVSTTAAARSAPSASRRLRGESSSARSPSTAGHGVLPPVSARPLDSVPRQGFVQRTLLGGTALGLGVTVKLPVAALGQRIPLPTASPECFNTRR
jgi:hypothetical protein